MNPLSCHTLKTYEAAYCIRTKTEDDVNIYFILLTT